MWRRGVLSGAPRLPGDDRLTSEMWTPKPAIELSSQRAVRRHNLSIVLRQVVWTNLGWAIFNLVPILPLDGGQIVAAILDRVFGVRGQRWARLVSVIAACALIAYGLAIQSIFLVVMLGMLALQNYRAWQMSSQWSEGISAQARTRARPQPAKSEPLEGAQRPPAGIPFARREPEPRGSGESMMIVVPALAHRQQ